MEDDVYFNAPRRRPRRHPPPQLVDQLLQNDVTDFCSRPPRREQSVVTPPGFKFCSHHQSPVTPDRNSRGMLFVRRENVPVVVKCELNGIEACALIDTTVSATAVSMEIVDKLRMSAQIVPPAEYIFTPLSKTVMEASGTLDDMDLTLGNVHQLTLCYVVENQQPEVIIGLDFLEETQSILDFESACLFVGGKRSERIPFLNVHDILKLARKSIYNDTQRCPSL